MSEESPAITTDLTAALTTLPAELKRRILEMCDETEDLLILCQLNKDWYEWMMPLIWGEIDFVSKFEGGDLARRTCRFFAHCDTLMTEMPKRWPALAARVRKLNLGRLHGVNILHDEWDGYDYAFFEEGVEGNNVFDVIAQFTNLDSLSIYLKNWWGFSDLSLIGVGLGRGMKNLKTLKVGGQMPPNVLNELLTYPENIEHLSVINLHECPGQGHGPDGITIYYEPNRFSNLKSVHLCKLADLDGRLTYEDSDQDSDEDSEDDAEEPKYASHMRWKFPRESEVSQLEEWAALLGSCSNTLEEVTLENQYLCGRRYDDDRDIDPGVTHPAEYGAFSIRESQRLLFPVLLQEWPKLKKLVLIGMGKIEDVNQTVHHLEPRVHVEQRLAGRQTIAGDATPEQISTPSYFYEEDSSF